MRKPHAAGAALFVMITALSFSCAQVKTVNVWKDEAYQKKPRKVLVISMGDDTFIRSFFENNLVQRLRAQGLEATAANKVFPEADKEPSSQAIAAKAKELGSDAVLISRTVKKREEATQNHPGSYRTAGFSRSGLFDLSYETDVVKSTPGLEYDADVFSVVTDLYDVQAEKPFWSFLSTVRVEGSKERGFEKYIDKLMSQLKSGNLL